MWKVKVKSLSHARLLETPWTVAHQAPPSMGIFQARVLEWGAIAFQKQSRFRLICGASTNCWPKTNRLPVLSPTKIRFIPRSARNYNWGFATVVNSMLVPAQQRDENSSEDGERKLGWRWPLEELRVQSIVVFHWLSVTVSHWLSSCQARRGGLSSSFWALLWWERVRVPPFGPLALF